MVRKEGRKRKKGRNVIKEGRKEGRVPRKEKKEDEQGIAVPWQVVAAAMW